MYERRDEKQSEKRSVLYKSRCEKAEGGRGRAIRGRCSGVCGFSLHFFLGVFRFSSFWVFGFWLFLAAGRTQCWHVPNAILTGFARTHLHKVTEKRRRQQQQQQQHEQSNTSNTVAKSQPPYRVLWHLLLPCCVRGWHNLRLKGLNLSCRLSPMSALIFHLRWLPPYALFLTLPLRISLSL